MMGEKRKVPHEKRQGPGLWSVLQIMGRFLAFTLSEMANC